MDREAVERFLSRKTPYLVKFFMPEAEGLESEGWSISVENNELVFITPTLEWGSHGVVSTSRYQMRHNGPFSGWFVTALDRKPHWPKDLPSHPNLRPETPCMGASSDVFQQHNPFVTARAIASMLQGPVLPMYQAWRYGDVPFEGIKCPLCEKIIYPYRKTKVMDGVTTHKTCFDRRNRKQRS